MAALSTRVDAVRKLHNIVSIMLLGAGAKESGLRMRAFWIAPSTPAAESFSLLYEWRKR